MEYRKLSNQARFVTEIIENKLIVSKKSKPTLVTELRKKGYEAFPKVKDAKKAGETDDVVENTDDATDEDGGARDFDYLLGLPIWSLTQERVDKLEEQMLNKKKQLDDFKALSELDLWCADLDEFLAVWYAREQEDREVAKKIRSMGRRVSKKIGAGKSSGRGRVVGDDDYAPKVSKATKPAKPNAAKGVVKVEPAKTSRDRMIKAMFPPAKPKATMDGATDEDELSDADFAAIEKGSRAPSEQPLNGRSKRAAAAKPKNWMVDDEESTDSDSDKLLGDIGDMVKGIGAVSGDKPSNGRVSLHETSRSANGTSIKAKPKAKAFDLTEDDETNYEMLARSSPNKPAPSVRDDLDSLLSDDDELDVVMKKAPAVRAKPAVKAKRSLIAKKSTTSTSAVPTSKPVTLSPAAKAYMAKQSKMKTAPAKSKALSSDDDLDDMDVDQDDSPPPRAATASRRPARAAAVAKPKKAAYVELSDEDEDVDMDDQDESAIVQDDDSEDEW